MPQPPGLDLAAQLAQALPQTQCRRCGYDDCAAYAQAMASAQADINRCPPGGAEGVQRLARLTGRPALPLDPDCGSETARTVVQIDESWCIGCTLCIKACPVDAIVGANKFMHTVVAQDCTGCGLCLPACPVDCMVAVNASGSATGWAAWSQPQAAQALQRYTQRTQRLARQGDKLAAQENAAPPTNIALSPAAAAAPPPAASTPATRQAAVALALAQARAKRSATTT